MYRLLLIASIGVFYVMGDSDCDTSSESDSDEVDCGYCVNFEGCESDTIDADTAKCYGYLSCYDAEIESEYVYAYGYKALFNATVTGATKMTTYGYMGAHYAESLRTSTIDGYGMHGASCTEVYAYDDTLEANFYGYRSGYKTDVYCGGGEDCTVRCGESQGCEDLALFCGPYSTCEFDCSDDTDYCPTLYCYSNADCTCDDGSDSDCDDYTDSDLTDADMDAISVERAAWRTSTRHDGVFVDKFPDKAASAQKMDELHEQEMAGLIPANLMAHNHGPISVHNHNNKHHHNVSRWTESPVFFWGLFALVVVFTNFVTYMCFFKARNGYTKLVDQA